MVDIGRRSAVAKIFSSRRGGLEPVSWLLSGRAVGHTASEILGYYRVSGRLQRQSYAGQQIWYYSTGLQGIPNVQVFFEDGRVSQVIEF